MKKLLSHASQAILEAGLIALLVVGLLATTAFAGRGGGGGHTKPGSGSGSSSLAVVMVTDGNGNGSPNWGDTITFRITTTATQSPYVDLTCSQNGTLVYSASAGFYADFPWPGAQNMPLESPSWTGGAASCKAVLNNGLATLTFTAGA